MEAIRDFEDLLEELEAHEIRYLIVGGLAFIFHAKPRYTKDMDLWIDPDPDNVARLNTALDAFGSPHFFSLDAPEDVLQLGVAPNRIDFLLDPAAAGGPSFSQAWKRRLRADYGQVEANWIDLDGLLDIKRHIDHPRHQDDARILQTIRDQSPDV